MISLLLVAEDVAQAAAPQRARASLASTLRIEQIAQCSGGSARIDQIAATSRAPLGDQPESSLTRDAPNPDLDLYREVATVWQLIRARGQQPTPELIAREIGPDNLALFLRRFPRSDTMFGVDSDVLPVAPPRKPEN